jgi:hypothetical protein
MKLPEYPTPPPDKAAGCSDHRLVLPKIAGRSLGCSLNEFERRCKVWLATEQEKPLPDNALVALLCDAVRLGREYGDTMTNYRENDL